MKTLQELLYSTTSTTGGYQIPEYIYDKVVGAAKIRLVGRQLCGMVLGPDSIPGSSVKLNIATKDTLSVNEIPEAAEIPTDFEAVGQREITPKKYGVRILITNEMIEDSKFDEADRNIKRAGYEMAKKEDSLIWKQAYDNAGNTVNAGSAWTVSDIVDGKTYLTSNDYNPTDLVVSPTVAGDMQKIDTFTEADKLGSREMHENGFIGKILGMQTYVSKQVNQSTTYDGFVLDREYALVLAEKRPLTIQNYKDEPRDMSAWAVTQRVAASYIQADAICRIYST
jgi:HK97 family phage major capsid protein